MEIKKLDCPSCGASLEWNTPSCNFCKTEVRYFENNTSALPINLTASDIENNIILFERDFWKASVLAVSAPYFQFKDYKNHLEQDFKNDWFNNPIFAKVLTMFYESYFILPSENLVQIYILNQIGDYALLTSLRMIIFRDTSMISIPYENFISWDSEKAGINGLIGRDGYEYDGHPVLKFFVGGKEIVRPYDSCDTRPFPEVIAAIIASKEWQDLNPLQKNLLTLNRYNVNKSYKILVKPFELMEFIPKETKKACFIATATMGDYNHPSVLLLQDFRDTYLINKTWGRSFINWYYTNGPYIASIIAKNKLLKKISYWFIVKPLVFISKILIYSKHGIN